jgi:hypothetical protein
LKKKTLENIGVIEKKKKKKGGGEHNPLIFGGLLMAYSCGLYLNKKRV